MKNFGFLIAAYSAMWVLIAYFFIRVGAKVNTISKKVEMLEEERNA